MRLQGTPRRGRRHVISPIDPRLWKWKQLMAVPWRQPGHINELELAGYNLALSWRVRNPRRHSKRFLHLLDSEFPTTKYGVAPSPFDPASGPSAWKKRDGNGATPAAKRATRSVAPGARVLGRSCRYPMCIAGGLMPPADPLCFPYVRRCDSVFRDTITGLDVANHSMA